MRIQRIRNRRVENALPFGKQLQAAAKAMLEDFVPDQDCGFQDGGCLMFAVALQNWSGGVLELAAIYRPDRPGRAQHVVARFGTELFLDSDGAGLESDLTAKMAALEGVPEAFIAGWDSALNQGDIPFDAMAMARLVRQLEHRLGAFDEASFAPYAREAEAVPAGPR